MMYAVCGTQFMQGVDTGYRRPRRIRRRKTLLLSLNIYGAFMPVSNQFSPSKHRQRELCNLNLKLSFCAKVSFSLLQILRDSWSWVPFALIILTKFFWNTANQIENWESRRRPGHPGRGLLGLGFNGLLNGWSRGQRWGEHSGGERGEGEKEEMKERGPRQDEASLHYCTRVRH